MSWSYLSIMLAGFGIAMYVVLDGFDLGVGILFPFARTEGRRDLLINSIAPVWDGNETWLIMNGAMLYGAFPTAYAILFSAWYLPVMVLLVALVFRGVAFEFRARARARRKRIWNVSFSAGSVIAAFAQGVMLGSFIRGFETRNSLYAGGAFDWLTPFSITTGAALVCGYALLGLTWLIYRTEGDLQAWSYRNARGLVFVILSFIVVVSVWTALAFPQIKQRWFYPHDLLWLSPFPLFTLADAVLLLRALQRRNETAPFVYSALLFLLCFVGLIASLWPYLVPWSVTIEQAAAPAQSQRFLLVGALLLLPLVLGYTVYTYRVFRSKVAAGEGYH